MYLLLLFIFFPLAILLSSLLFLIPLRYALVSLLSIFTVPLNLWELYRNPQLRKNHALEHATINVLEGYYRKKGWLSGYAKEDGFYILGPVDIDILEKAVREALMRLKAGEKNLAVHPSCGTGRAVGSFVSGIILISIMLVGKVINIGTILIAALLSAYLGPVLGEIAQSLFTTLPNVKDLVVYEIVLEMQPQLGPLGTIVPVFSESYFIRTGKQFYQIF